ncbi:TPA: transposase [Serratia marcescens]|nr:transposase [Serratia marcescens]HEB0068165.1 transposase [Serratia marcescens]HEB0073027.1 transposase [Serratia marcescens]HEB0092308.1 transposase [Serratia marcescens]HEB0127958.1 transposase [Serratia marcescens]
MRKTLLTAYQIIPSEVRRSRTHRKDVCRKVRISETLYYNWKAKFGGMESFDIKKTKDLKDEYRRLKQTFADLNLES